jgi:hypothetical protein
LVGSTAMMKEHGADARRVDMEQRSAAEKDLFSEGAPAQAHGCA